MIDDIIKVLNNNGLIAIPTDTVYGLIGNPFSKISVDNAYEIKNRDKSKKFSIFLDDRKKIKDICITNTIINEFIQNQLYNNTIILEKKEENYLNLISDKTIGIRIPNNKFLLDLLKQYKQPVFATSINKSGEKECLTYNEVIKNFLNKIDLIIKGKIICTNKPSSIFKFENNKIIQIR